jgi:Domain of unknown function (DUF397)
MGNEGSDWRKASYSNGSGNCVEVRSVARVVAVRDTTNREGCTLSVASDAWTRFTDSLRYCPPGCRFR